MLVNFKIAKLWLATRPSLPQWRHEGSRPGPVARRGGVRVTWWVVGDGEVRDEAAEPERGMPRASVSAQAQFDIQAQFDLAMYTPPT